MRSELKSSCRNPRTALFSTVKLFNLNFSFIKIIRMPQQLSLSLSHSKLARALYGILYPSISSGRKIDLNLPDGEYDWERERKRGKEETALSERERRGEETMEGRGLRSKPSVALSRQLGGDSWVPSYSTFFGDSQPREHVFWQSVYRQACARSLICIHWNFWMSDWF